VRRRLVQQPRSDDAESAQRAPASGPVPGSPLRVAGLILALHLVPCALPWRTAAAAVTVLSVGIAAAVRWRYARTTAEAPPARPA
jgi:hypothetical protein